MINFLEKQDKGTGLSPALMNRYKKAASQSNYVANQRYGRISSTSGLSKKYKDSKLSDQQKVMKKRDKGLNMAAKKTGTWGQQEEAIALAPLVPYLATAAATASRISPQTYAQLPSMAMNKAKQVGKAAKTTYKKFKKYVSGKKTNEEAMTAADAGIPQDTKNMGPSRLPMHILRRKLGLPIDVTDRRVSKKKPPRLKKKFKFS